MNRQILLIEDEIAHALLIRAALESKGWSFVHALSIKEAVDYLNHKESPDLCLSDLNLSDAKGVETVSQLKGQNISCPIIVLTASTSLQDAIEAMRAGAEDFVVKSFDANFAEVLQLSVQRSYQRQLERAEAIKNNNEKEWLRRAIEYGQDGLAVVSPEGLCRYKNAAFATFLQRCGLNLQGKIYEVAENLPVKNPTRVIEQFSFALAGESNSEVINFEIELVDASQAESAYLVSVAQLFNQLPVENNLASPNASISSVDESLDIKTSPPKIVWTRDISELKRREAFQRDIISATTHDLKGPLGAISLSAELLGKVKDTAKAEEIRLRIASMSKSCQNLIDEFLSANSIKAGALIVKKEPVEVLFLLQQVIKEQQALAEPKGIELSVDSQKAQPSCHWPLDQLALKRVLSNLVSNGIKYTPSGVGGSVKLSFEVLSDLLLIKVSDTGMGVEPSKITTIFEPYARLARDSKEEGHGLGLFVARSIVSAHGGSISVESSIGKGSVFTVSLPK